MACTEKAGQNPDTATGEMAAPGEVACPGGEVAFVRAIIRDSLRLKQRVRCLAELHYFFFFFFLEIISALAQQLSTRIVMYFDVYVTVHTISLVFLRSFFAFMFRVCALFYRFRFVIFFVLRVCFHSPHQPYHIPSALLFLLGKILWSRDVGSRV